MSRFKFVPNSSGIRQLMRSQPCMDVCREYASQVLERASASSPGYEMEERRYPERNGYAVFPGDDEAYYDNLANDTLLRSRGF